MQILIQDKTRHKRMTFEPIRIGNTVVRRTKSATGSYEIKNETSPHLMKSLSSIVASTSAVKAVDIMTLEDYIRKNRHAIEIYVALNLVRDFGKQMQALISSGWSMACVGVNDVVVITHRENDKFTHESVEETLGDARMDPQFLFLNDHLLFEVDSDGTLNIDHALPKGNKAKQAFMSPELQQLIKAVSNNPSSSTNHEVHFKTIFYSAARLLIYFLLNVEHIPEDENDDAYLNPIKLTKLYWFLLRCLNPVPEKRKYIYI